MCERVGEICLFAQEVAQGCRYFLFILFIEVVFFSSYSLDRVWMFLFKSCKSAFAWDSPLGTEIASETFFTPLVYSYIP